jgi:predicted dehydrogenase
MARKTTRRDFLQTSAAVSTAFWTGHSIQPTFAQSGSTVEKINFASIGVEGKGSSDSKDAGNHGNMVAICDIDERRLEKAAARFPDAKKFVDYREMLTEMGDKIDAVTVSTPDHSHAPASLLAMSMGKHCFTQKPLTWSVYEAKLMRDVANEKGVATQMGNQGTSNNGLREGVEIVRAGLLGDIKEVHVWTNRPIWPQGAGRPKKVDDIPSGLHWDLFLGPAQERPYSSVYAPFKWRGWVDFGTGALGDMACHTANMVVMAADLFDAETVVAESSGMGEGEQYPSRSKITFQFGSRPRGDGEGEWGPTPLYWYDGGNLPAQELVPGVKFKGSGSMIVGTEATLYSPNDYGSAFTIYKPGTNEAINIKKPEPTLPRSPGHFKEYAIACSGGPAAMSNFNYAARLTQTILFGNVALRAGKQVSWDPEKFTCGDAETDKLLHRIYRPAFATVPELQWPSRG